MSVLRTGAKVATWLTWWLALVLALMIFTGLMPEWVINLWLAALCTTVTGSVLLGTTRRRRAPARAAPLAEPGVDLKHVLASERALFDGQVFHCANHSLLARQGQLIALHDGVCPLCGPRSDSAGLGVQGRPEAGVRTPRPGNADSGRPRGNAAGGGGGGTGTSRNRFPGTYITRETWVEVAEMGRREPLILPGPAEIIPLDPPAEWDRAARLVIEAAHAVTHPQALQGSMDHIRGWLEKLEDYQGEAAGLLRDRLLMAAELVQAKLARHSKIAAACKAATGEPIEIIPLKPKRARDSRGRFAKGGPIRERDGDW